MVARRLLTLQPLTSFSSPSQPLAPPRSGHPKRTPEAGASAGELLEEAWGAGGSASEGTSTARATWAGVAELVSSILAFFADLEAAVPFLL